MLITLIWMMTNTPEGSASCRWQGRLVVGGLEEDHSIIDIIIIVIIITIIIITIIIYHLRHDPFLSSITITKFDKHQTTTTFQNNHLNHHPLHFVKSPKP